MDSVRILFYAIDGIGLGHLTRLTAVAREVRALSRALGFRADLQLVTTSEGSDLVQDFPVYKIPSKSVVARSDANRGHFVAAAKSVVANVVASLRPDILVLDTVAEGAFRELTFLRDFARLTCFIDRIRNSVAAGDSRHQAHLALYDRILVPDDESHASHYPMASHLRERRSFVGRIHAYRPEDAWTALRVRAHFCVDQECSVVFVSAGGGGDKAAAEQLRLIVDALRAPQRHLLVGYGPLYRGEKVYGSGVTPVVEPEIWRFFPGVDVAVSAAGYNTYEELLAARVPSVFFSQAKGLDPQEERIRQGMERGWHESVPELDTELLRAAVERCENLERRIEIERVLRARGRPMGALHAATELLALHARLDDSPVKRRNLLFCAAARNAWQPCPDVAFDASFDAMNAWYRAVLDRGAWEGAVERAVAGWQTDRSLNDWIAWGEKLVRWRRQLDWPQERWDRFLRGTAGKFHGAHASADLVEELLSSAQDNVSTGDTVAAIVDQSPIRGMASRLAALVPGLEPSAIDESLPNDECLTEAEGTRAC